MPDKYFCISPTSAVAGSCLKVWSSYQQECSMGICLMMQNSPGRKIVLRLLGILYCTLLKIGQYMGVVILMTDLAKL